MSHHWSSIPNLCVGMDDRKENSPIALETHVLVSLKLDGTNVSKDTAGYTHGRRVALDVESKSYQKASLRELTCVDVSAVRDAVFGISCKYARVYGELCCNTKHGAKIGEFFAFGLSVDYDKKMTISDEFKWYVSESDDGIKVIFVVLNAKLASIFTALGYRHPRILYDGKLRNIVTCRPLCNLLLAENQQCEGVVLTMSTSPLHGFHGNTCLMKLKTHQECQPRSVGLAKINSNSGDDFWTFVRDVVTDPNAETIDEKKRLTDQALSSACSKHMDVVDLAEMIVRDMLIDVEDQKENKRAVKKTMLQKLRAW
jgi:hypothetical protein